MNKVSHKLTQDAKQPTSACPVEYEVIKTESDRLVVRSLQYPLDRRQGTKLNHTPTCGQILAVPTRQGTGNKTEITHQLMVRSWQYPQKKVYEDCDLPHFQTSRYLRHCAVLLTRCIFPMLIGLFLIIQTSRYTFIYHEYMECCDTNMHFNIMDCLVHVSGGAMRLELHYPLEISIFCCWNICTSFLCCVITYICCIRGCDCATTDIISWQLDGSVGTCFLCWKY